MTARTDQHRPSAIIPADYNFVAFDYIGPSMFGEWQSLIPEHRRFREHMARTGATFARHDHGGTCHICGATAFYICKWHHPKSNTYIVTGQDCAEKLGMGDPAAFRVFREAINAEREHKAGKQKAARILAEAGLQAAWDLYVGDEGRDGQVVDKPTSIIFDVCSKLVKYGSVSDKQIELLRKCMTWRTEAASRAANRAAEDAAAADVPQAAGRTTFEGTVIALREPDPWGPYPSWKMLVKHATGYKIWGSRPAAISEVARGDKVRFVAMISRSDKDSKFGFFSRPTKAEIIEHAEDHEAAPETDPENIYNSASIKQSIMEDTQD